MKQSFLDSLIGLLVKEAEAAVLLQGLETWTMPEDSAYILLAYSKTVQLFHDENDMVTSAQSAGDDVDPS